MMQYDPPQTTLKVIPEVPIGDTFRKFAKMPGVDWLTRVRSTFDSVLCPSRTSTIVRGSRSQLTKKAGATPVIQHAVGFVAHRRMPVGGLRINTQ
jgi:hypothetical protein